MFFFSSSSCKYRLDISDMLERTTADDKGLTTVNNKVREGTDWEHGKISIPLSFDCISLLKKRNDRQRLVSRFDARTFSAWSSSAESSYELLTRRSPFVTRTTLYFFF